MKPFHALPLLFTFLACLDTGELADDLGTVVRVDSGTPAVDAGPRPFRDITLTVFIRDQSTWDGGRGRMFGGPGTMSRARWQNADGGWSTANGVNLSDGGYLIRDVPRGEVWIAFPTIDTVLTDADHIDCSEDMHGRADAPTAYNSLQQTGVVIQPENLGFATNADDFVALYSSGGPVSLGLFPPTGTTQFAFQFAGQRLPMLSGSQGDRIWLSVSSYQRNGSIWYSSPHLLGSAPAPDMELGVTVPVPLRLETPTLAQLEISVAAPDFHRVLTSQRPGLDAGMGLLTIDYSPNLPRIGAVVRGWYGNNSVLNLVYSEIAADSPALAGTVTYPSAFPRIQLLATARFTADVPLLIGGTTRLLVIEQRRTSRLGIPPLVLVPTLGPPTNLAINGLSTVDTPRTGVGRTPRISWSPPTMGSPDHYLVTIATFEGANPLQVGSSMLLRRHELVLPPDTLMPGRTYVAVITARSGAYRPLVPNYQPPESERIQVVTGPFTP